MTVDELRQRLLASMERTNAKMGADQAPKGLEAAIRALPDTRLLRRLPQEYVSFIERELRNCAS